MATATTSAQTIREDRRDAIEDLRPGQHRQVRMREYKRNGDFRAWAESKPAACFRRFQVRDLVTYEIPTISDVLTEEVKTQFEIVVAYPASGIYGADAINGLEDAIRADQILLETALGAVAHGDYPSGCNLFQLASVDIEREEDVYFLVAIYDVLFKRDVTLDVLDLNASASIASAATVAAVSSLINNFQGVADITATATVTGAGTIDYSQAGAITANATVTAAATFAAGGIDATIEGILTAADPMQELIDAMVDGGAAISKPDYMWGGDDASGATEIGAGSVNLTASAVTQSQTSAVLGDGNFTVYDANGDRMSSTSASLQVGSGSFAAIWVGNLTSTTGNYIMGDANGTLGWALLTGGGGTKLQLYLWHPSGLNTAVVTATVPTVQGEVIIVAKDSTALDGHLFTSVGDATNASVHDEDLNLVSPRFAVGDLQTGNAARQEFGICALWLGANAEAITTTHRSNLATFLSF